MKIRYMDQPYIENILKTNNNMGFSVNRDFLDYHNHTCPHCGVKFRVLDDAIIDEIAVACGMLENSKSDKDVTLYFWIGHPKCVKKRTKKEFVKIQGIVLNALK